MGAPLPLREPSPFRLGTRPALDGIRGIGIAMVLLFHSLTYMIDWYGPYGDRVLRGANSAVDVFFMLSGFLITVLLLEEHERHGRVSFKRFYMRRVLRLFPVLYATLALFALYLLVVRPDGASGFVGAAVKIATWTANFFIGHDLFLTQWFGQTWSLAIEEQFYVVWPITLVLLLRVPARRRGALIVGLLVVLTVAFGLWRSVLFSRTELWSAVYYRTDARFDQLLVGCLLGAALHFGYVRERARPWMAVFGLGLWLLIAQTVSPFDALYYHLGAPLTNLAAVALTLGVLTGDGPVVRLLAWRPLRWLGRMSYALYIVHVPVYFAVVTATAGREGVTVARLVGANVLTFALVLLLHRLVEAPALRLKRRWAPGGPPAVAAHDPADPGPEAGAAAAADPDRPTVTGEAPPR
ncbi:acyltransferase [Nitriliruptoraceae bacterium ZYF776]|nr:acyltransferase [Profundirhabdus halotolerans]